MPRYIQANTLALSAQTTNEHRTISAFVAGVVGLLLAVWSPSAAAEDRFFTDSAGRRVALPAAVERVFAAGPPAAVLLYSLAPDKLIGWPRELSAEAKAILPTRYAALPVVGRLTGHENNSAIAAVSALRPDLIVDVGDVEPEYVALADRVQAESGIPYIVIDGSLPRTAEAYRTVGALLGVQPAADELAELSDELLEAVRTALANADGDKPLRAYFARGKDGLETATAGSVLTESIEACGVALFAPDSTRGEHAKTSIPQITLWDPDIVVTSDQAVFEAISSSAQWASLRAVRERRVFLAPSGPFGWIDSPPGVNRLLGVRWLAGRLYPTVFDQDLREVRREFYEKFLHISLSTTQLDDLLRVASMKPP